MSRLLLAVSLFAAGCTAAVRPCPCPEPTPASSSPAGSVRKRPVPTSGPERRDEPVELGRVSLLAVGDVLPHVSVKLSAAAAAHKDEKGASTNHDGYDALLADVAPEISAADLSLANLETPVSPSGDAGAVEYHFNAPPALLAGLKASGFKLVSFANNHVFDQGKKGFVETLDELDKAGLPYFGAGRTAKAAYLGLRVDRNGVRLAFLGASAVFNAKKDLYETKEGEPHANRAEEPLATVEAIKAARASSDFVIVSVHWGAEYQVKPREEEVQLAHQLFEAGADVILGSHPHVLQPLEIYEAKDGRVCLVIYSLGNFISNQSFQYRFGVTPERIGDTRDGALLKFAVVKRDWGAGGVRTELADVSFLPLWTENEHVGTGGKDTIFIRTVGTERALKAARQDLDAYLATVPPKPSKEQQAEVVRLKKRVGLFERRRDIVEGRLGADFAGEHLP